VENILVRENAMKDYVVDAKYESMVAATVVRLRRPSCAATRMTIRRVRESIPEITARRPRRHGLEYSHVQSLATDLLIVKSTGARSRVILRPVFHPIVRGRPT